MSINNVAIQAYGKAMEAQKAFEQKFDSRMAPEKKTTTFGETIERSIKNVSDMQNEKDSMIESFASGKNQNVHELMITLQKAGLAMNMTSAVRGKLMSAYQEVMRMSF